MRAKPKIEEVTPEVDVNTAFENYYNAIELWAEEAEQHIKELKEKVERLEDFAFEVCPLHREDDLHKILNKD